MNMPPKTNPVSSAAESVGDYADRAAARTEDAIHSTKRVANDALDSLQGKVEDLRQTVPSALTRAASHVDDVAHKTIDRARATSAQVRDQMHRATDRTVDYIKHEPVKSVLIAAATGAVVALLMGRRGRGRD